MQDLKEPFGKYLTAMTGAKEAGLIIAKDAGDAVRFAKAMDNHGFIKAKSVADLFNNPKVYIQADETMDKDVYDFFVQYPTGQVEIFSQKHMRSNVLTPEYKDSTVIAICVVDDLNTLAAKGFDLRAITGMAYQE